MSSHECNRNVVIKETGTTGTATEVVGAGMAYVTPYYRIVFDDGSVCWYPEYDLEFVKQETSR